MSEPSMSSLVDAFHQLGRTAQITNLQPVGFSARMETPEVSSSEEGQRCSAEVAVDLKVRRREGGFSVIGRFNCTVRTTAESPPKTVASFDYDVAVRYDTPAEEFSSELLEVYARSASVMHLWPYFRHFVQTSSAQLQILPPVLLPAFRPRSFDELLKEVQDHKSSVGAG